MITILCDHDLRRLAPNTADEVELYDVINHDTIMRSGLVIAVVGNRFKVLKHRYNGPSNFTTKTRNSLHIRFLQKTITAYVRSHSLRDSVIQSTQDVLRSFA